MQRMISAIGVVIFVAVIVLGAIWLGDVGESGRDGASGVSVPSQPSVTAELDGANVNSDLPLWRIDYSASHIKFVGVQAGAEFEGVWESWSANMRLSVDDLSASAFDVTIDATSAETFDFERDLTLGDPEWFDTMNFPAVYFRSSNFSRSIDGSYKAEGQIVIKSVASPMQLRFTVEENGNKRLLVGTAQLDRLALGIGTSEWEDTELVGKDVSVQVRVEAIISD